MAGYLLTWRSHGIGLRELQQLAPELLRHTASAPVLAIQRQASAVTLGAIVFGQIGTLLACRSDWKSIRSLPLRANPWIWLGIGSELLVYGGLLFIPVVAKEALENPSDPRDNGAVITGQDWIDGWQAARLLGLRADHGQEADQAGEVSL
jgi:magnesium-transporting ATPase (P-type)